MTGPRSELSAIRTGLGGSKNHKARATNRLATQMTSSPVREFTGQVTAESDILSPCDTFYPPHLA